MSMRRDSDKLEYCDENETQCNGEMADMNCKNHPSDKVTFYCYPCKEPICIECLRYDHKSLKHHYESISRTESRLDKELSAINDKIDYLESVEPQKEKIIEEIDFQYHQVQHKINETYQTFEILLKKYRGESLIKLEELRNSRKSKVIEAYSKMNDCSSEITNELHQFFTQLLRSNSMLDNIALKEKLIKELKNCVDRMLKLKKEFHVDFTKFNEQCFSEMIDDFSKTIEEKMILRIYHSLNPFLDKLSDNDKSTPKEVTIDHQIHDLNGVNEQTDECNSSQLPSPPSQETLIPNQEEQSEEEKEILMVEEKEKSSASDKNYLAEDHDSRNSPLKYFLAKNIDHNFKPKSLKLEKSFNYFITPQDFILNAKDSIIVADTGNHRIGVYDRYGNHKLEFGRYCDKKRHLVYPKYVSIFINSNSQNYGNIVVYDKENHCSRLQIFSEGGNYLQAAKFQEIDTINALTTTMDDLIITVDVSRQVFIISDTLEIINKIDCHGFLTAPFYIAAKDDEIFIADWKKCYIIAINRKGQFLGCIGFKKQTFCPRGFCLVGDKIIFTQINRYHDAVLFYEYSRDGSCYLKYIFKHKNMHQSGRFEITKDGFMVLLNKFPLPKIMILKGSKHFN
ncbi:GSCOCG00003293001-RA-CDS [Cotesia congregata]|uniref:Similar to brat: Brain tumor protein (Drosophila melanogaster) n=1 Tax=Cotesia congregata TaxID=51543 RepID=A0A8J2MSZ7_COTCN|nr:GSCOCG00003293001-RA-CDS [Cotesia congregata]CAG5108342.1 Similar to brat: Brain tumor protein (Drosophila melanogaster) [Cotesia congregata]